MTAILFGIGYPLVITGIAAVDLSAQGRRKPDPERRPGHRLRTAGAELHLRPATSIPGPRRRATATIRNFSGGSTLAQSNAKLVQRIQGDIDKLAAANPGKPVPIDMVTTSAPASIPTSRPTMPYYQAPRVAKARGLTEDQVRALIAQHTAGRDLRPSWRAARQRSGPEPGPRQDGQIDLPKDGFPAATETGEGEALPGFFRLFTLLFNRVTPLALCLGSPTMVSTIAQKLSRGVSS